jgi:miniconductance mechanosensitive channel
MQEQLIEWISKNVGAQGSMLAWYWQCAIVVGVILAAYLVDFIFVKAIIPTLRKITSKTNTQVDDILLSEKVVRSFSKILPPIILTFALPFVTQGTLELVIERLTVIYIIINVTRFLCILVGALFEALVSRGEESGSRSKARMHSMKGLVQTIQIIFSAVAAILIISILLDKSPAYLISGLGAMAAVLMLVFQDSIKGLVASILLMFNDMLEVGDWIVMTPRNVDGVVIEMTLTTIKVRNWDNTILTIPPYNMLTETFQNWRGMQESDGRRLRRTIQVDVRSVHFLTEKQAKKWNVTLENGRPMTNLEVYRKHLYDYLQHSSDINPDMTLMVRQLPATDAGIPVELYAFTRTKVWEEYEEINARLVEYAFATLSQFGLVAYQRGGLNPELLDEEK